MSYFVKNKTKKAVRGGSTRFSTQVKVAGGGKSKTFKTSKPANKFYNQSIEVDAQDAGVTLFKTTPVAGSATDALGAEMYDFKELVLHNRSPQVAEIMMQVQDWAHHATNDTADGTQTELKFLLGARQTFVLPTSKIIQYSAANSASNTHIRHFWNGATIDEDGNHEYPGQTDPLNGLSDTGTHNGATLDVVNSSATAFTDELGNYNYTSKYAHSDLSTNFFGVSADGFVPGSFMIRFCEKPFTTVNLRKRYNRRVLPTDDTKLTAGATYYFKVSIDGGTAEEIAFTLDTGNTTWGGNNGVIAKIQTQLNNEFELSSSQLFGKKVTVGMVNGDLRFTSHYSAKHHNNGGAESAIQLSAGTTGTNLFAGTTGMIPNDITDTAPRFSPFDKPNFIMWDDGQGNLRRQAGGVGTINYSTGMMQMTGLPSNTEMAIVAINDSALGGESTTLGAGQGTAVNNIMVHVKGRSTNLYRNSLIDVFVAGY